jgi:HAD superfamily hydrolase (TIGR01509 family)
MARHTVQAAAAVIDCDGTLVTTERLWGIAERRITERYGGAWSIDLKRQLVGRSVRESAAAVARWTRTSPYRVEAMTTELHDAYAELLATTPIAPKPGAAELLEACERLGIAVAVASNSRPGEVEAALAGAGLRAHVRSIHTPSPTLAAKPAPDLYLDACRALGVAPSAAVAIEDSQAGLDAAHAAGLPTIGVPSLPGQRLHADLVLASLAELELELELEPRVPGRLSAS